MKIIVLSDGGSWETFDPSQVRVLELTDDGFQRLLDGETPNDLDEGDVRSDTTLEDMGVAS